MIPPLSHQRIEPVHQFLDLGLVRDQRRVGRFHLFLGHFLPNPLLFTENDLLAAMFDFPRGHVQHAHETLTDFQTQSRFGDQIVVLFWIMAAALSGSVET